MATVSRVLNRRTGVGDETRARVMAVLADVPYTRRGLGALARTGVLGVLMPELGNPVFPAFAEALETRAAAAGYSLLLCDTRSSSVREEQYVRMLLGQGVDGMVFLSPEAADTGSSHGHYQQLLEDGVQMVFINGQTPPLGVPDIRIDAHSGGYAATRYLIELGHERIGFVCGPARSIPARLLQSGWTAALEEAELTADPAFVSHAPFGAAGGASGIAKLLGSVRPSAVICSSDLMAFGAISEAQSRGWRVPEDLSVIGFDDIALASYSSPSLTSMAQPIKEMAKAAIDELLGRLGTEHPEEDSYSRVFRPRLVVRDSTAPPR
jgi:DNA-binding LacI/PurR family transcriptional regulator